MKTPKKILITRNQDAIEQMERAAKAAIPSLQQLVDEGGKIGIEITTDNFHTASCNPEKFAKDVFISKMESVPQAGAFAMKREALLDIVELPDTSRFIRAANECQRLTKTLHKSLLKVEDGQALFNEQEFSQYVESLTRYATTPEQIELWKRYQRLEKVLNSFNEKAGGGRGISFGNFPKFFSFNGSRFAVKLEVYFSLID